MLVLFDIDGTLLLTHGAGIAAMQDAGRELFGDQFTFEGIETAGRLDTLIWQDAARKNGVIDHEAEHSDFRRRYLVHLSRRLKETPTVERMPGVLELVGALRENRTVTLGLLTGNYEETGRLKISHAGLDPDSFSVNAWGIDGAHRRDLPRAAMEHFAEHHGTPIEPGQVVIIGDTPHDIDCARANGCRSLAVATGMCPAAELAAHEPDLLVDDLSDTPSIVGWMLNPVETVFE